MIPAVQPSSTQEGKKDEKQKIIITGSDSTKILTVTPVKSIPSSSTPSVTPAADSVTSGTDNITLATESQADTISEKDTSTVTADAASTEKSTNEEKPAAEPEAVVKTEELPVTDATTVEAEVKDIIPAATEAEVKKEQCR